MQVGNLHKYPAAARGYPRPLAGRSSRPSRPRLTACPLRFAGHRSAAGGLVVAALAPIARLSGTGSPSQHHRSHVNPEGRARVRMAAPPRPNRMREITERGAAHAPGAGVCRQAKPGWRSAGDIRVSRGLEGNPVRHGRCALATRQSEQSRESCAPMGTTVSCLPWLDGRNARSVIRMCRG